MSVLFCSVKICSGSKWFCLFECLQYVLQLYYITNLWHEKTSHPLFALFLSSFSSPVSVSCQLQPALYIFLLIHCVLAEWILPDCICRSEWLTDGEQRCWGHRGQYFHLKLPLAVLCKLPLPKTGTCHKSHIPAYSPRITLLMVRFSIFCLLFVPLQLMFLASVCEELGHYLPDTLFGCHPSSQAEVWDLKDCDSNYLTAVS